MKRCPDCGQQKPLEDFPRNRSATGGRGCYCKSCHNARGRESMVRLYGTSRHYHLRRKYRLGAAEVEEMIKGQGGLCAICRKKPAEQVDHEHETGRVRGVLCDGCNGGLGAFKEREDLLLRAIEYLERHS